jgi:hypothetical protein
MNKFIRKNIISTTIIVILLIIVFLLSSQKENSKTLSDSNDIDLQTKCASSAKSFYEYFVTDPVQRATAEYSNHYNSNLNKCFVSIKQYSTLDTGGFHSTGSEKDLFDAIEKKKYGSYSWMSEKDKKYWDVPPLWCEMYVDGNESSLKTCKSEEEFDAFTTGYMTN